MSRRRLKGCGGLLAISVLLFVALLVGFVLGGDGDVETPTGEVRVNKQQIIEEAQKVKRWIEQEVKEEVPRLQKVMQRIQQEPQEAQKQREEEQP